MRHNPFEIVRMFEETVADYCGAPYAVSSNITRRIISKEYAPQLMVM